MEIRRFKCYNIITAGLRVKKTAEDRDAAAMTSNGPMQSGEEHETDIVKGWSASCLLVFSSSREVTLIKAFGKHSSIPPHTQGQIEKALAEVKKEKFSLVMLDIDNFKQVNDTYGHQDGDSVIVALADILRNRKTCPMQSSGRWGGEEFMVLLRGTDSSSA